MSVVLPQSFREERWVVFERELHIWLDTPQGRFAAFWAERQRPGAGDRADHEEETRR